MIVGVSEQLLKRLSFGLVETFVPGHGPVGTRADIALEKEYITTLEILVAQAIRDDITVEEVLERRLPSPFDAWSLDGTPLETNVRVLYELLSQ